MTVRTPIKISLLVMACLMVVALTLKVFGAGRKAGDDSKAALKVGKTETKSSLSSSSITSSSSEGATFSARRVLLFTENPHPFNQEIVARLLRQLKDCPQIESIEVTNPPLLFTDGNTRPDLFLAVDLLKLDQHGIVSSTMNATVAASLGNTPWASTSHTYDGSTPPLVDFHWNATSESETVFTGLRTDRYADAAQSIAVEFSKAIRKQIEDLSEKYPALPELPEEFYGPYQPVDDFESLKRLQARRVASFCGLFTHNQTFWQFQTQTNPVPQLEQLISRLEAAGWRFNDVQLTNTLAWRARGRLDEAEIEIFRQRREGLRLPEAGEKETNVVFVAHYRKPFSREERETAIDRLFAQGESVEALLPFQNSFSSTQRKQFLELASKAPSTSPQVCIQLAEHYLRRKLTNDAVRLLTHAKALEVTLKDPSPVRANIDGVTKKVSPKQSLKLEVTPEVCRELGFLELTNRTQLHEQRRGFGQPLIFFSHGQRGIKVGSLTVNAPQNQVYPWRFTETEDGMRTSSSSTFTPGKQRDWHHKITIDGQPLKITIVPLPDQKQVGFTIEAGD